jgi:hypothetical protein
MKFQTVNELNGFSDEPVSIEDVRDKSSIFDDIEFNIFISELIGSGLAYRPYNDFIVLSLQEPVFCRGCEEPLSTVIDLTLCLICGNLFCKDCLEAHTSNFED